MIVNQVDRGRGRQFDCAWTHLSHTAGFLTDRLGNLTLIRGSVGTMASKLM